MWQQQERAATNPVHQQRLCQLEVRTTTQPNLVSDLNFSTLRDCIPNVPCDTKLSKIKTLRLATSYIDYLMNLLNTENPDAFMEGFKAEIHKKWNEKTEEQKRRELVRSRVL